MPTIPQFDASAAYPDRPDLATANPERFGKDAAALAALGGELGDFGSRLMTTRKRAMENDAVSQAHADDIKWTADTTAELKLSYTKKDENGNPILNPDGTLNYNVDGFSKELEQKINDRRKAQMEVMPTGDAQRGYVDATRQLFGATYMHGMQWENVTKAETYSKNIDYRNNEQSNFLINNPDLTTANESISQLQLELNKAVTDKTLNPGEAQDSFRKGARQRIMALFTGYGNNPTTAREGLKVLNYITDTAPRDYRTGEPIMDAEAAYPEAGQQISKTTDANGKVTTTISAGGMRKGIYGSGLDVKLVQESLTAQEIGTFRNRLEGVVKQDDHVKVGELRNWARNARSILTSTDPNNADRFNMGQAKNNILLMENLSKQPDSPLTKVEVDDTKINLSLAYAYRQVRSEFDMMPPSTKAEFDKRLQEEWDVQLKNIGVEDRTFGAEHQKQFQNLNEQVWHKMIAERKSDVVHYVEAHAQPQGSVQNGVPDEERFMWRVSKANSLEMPGKLYSKNELGSSVAELKQLSISNPQQAANRLQELKDRSGRFAPMAMQEMIQRGKLPAYFQEAFEQDDPGAAMSIVKNREPGMKDALEKSVVGTVNKNALNTAVDSSFKSAGAAFWQAGGQKASEYMKQAVRLEAIDIHNTDNVSYSDASKQAMDKLVSSQYHVLNGTFVPRRIGNVPITEGNELKNINAAMQLIYDPKTQVALGIEPPAMTNAAGGRADRSASIALGRWRTNPDNAGATFMVPLGSGSWTAVRDKRGQPITIDYLSAGLNPTPEAINFNRHWWQTAYQAQKNSGVAQAAVPNYGSAPGDNQVALEAQTASAEFLNIPAKNMAAMDAIRKAEAARKKRK